MIRPAAAGYGAVRLRAHGTRQLELRTVRKVATLAALCALVPLQALSQSSGLLGTAQLQVSGARLWVYSDSLTTDAEQTLNVGEPGRVRTCYGPGAGCVSTAVGSTPGLKVVADLTGPELPQAVPYETTPGGTFFLPGFQREGDYLLENIRLVETATGHVLANAEPSLATLHVRQILLASATVTRLTLADLQARGIALTQQNFQAFTERRTQKGLGPVQTDYFYDDRERLTRIQRTQIAGSNPGSIVPLAETTLDYDPKNGFLKKSTTAAGVITTYEFDEMGRMKSVTPPTSGSRTFGYDEMGRLTFATDGDDGVWKGTYDEWGGLVREQLPTGAVIAREYDAAGGLVSARLNDGAGGGDLAAVDNVYVTSFGETKSLRQVQSSAPNAPALDMKRDFDGNGRLVRQTSAGRKDLELAYESVTGRVTSVADSVRQLTLDYKAKPAPWADSLSFGEAQTGAGGFVPTVTSDVLSRDAYGRPTVESRSDGSNRQSQYDEAGNPLSLIDGASLTTFSWDSRGNLINLTRPGPQGATTYGYDLDGRLVKKHSIAGASGQAFDTSYDYEPGTGRLHMVTRPDGATETYHYNSDDTVQSVERSDGATLTYNYDPGNRVTKRTGAGGSVLSGGETFTWDLASRLGTTSRVDDKGDPIPGTAVTMTAYDLAGRPHEETVGARPALTREYDVFGHVTSLGLPTGIGAFGALSYLRAYEAGTQRLASLTATGDAPSVPGVALASLGAKWAWLGDDRVLGVTTNGPLAAAHRFGYVGGPGGPAGAAKWKLGTLTIGTAGGSDPFVDAGVPLGDPTGKGSKPWGQFAYGYVTGAVGDGTKLGRAVTGTGLPLGSILAGQGWAYGVDASKRLTTAYAGPGDIRGIDAGGAAAIAAFERFKYDYGTADQLIKADARESRRRPSATTPAAKAARRSPDRSRRRPTPGPKSLLLIRRHEAPHLRRSLHLHLALRRQARRSRSSRTAGRSKTANPRTPPAPPATRARA